MPLLVKGDDVRSGRFPFKRKYQGPNPNVLSEAKARHGRLWPAQESMG